MLSTFQQPVKKSIFHLMVSFQEFASHLYCHKHPPQKTLGKSCTVCLCMYLEKLWFICKLRNQVSVSSSPCDYVSLTASHALHSRVDALKTKLLLITAVLPLSPLSLEVPCPPDLYMLKDH